jgi:hypothetical protein
VALQRAEQEQTHEVGIVLVTFQYQVAQIPEDGPVVAAFQKQRQSVYMLVSGLRLDFNNGAVSRLFLKCW